MGWKGPHWGQRSKAGAPRRDWRHTGQARAGTGGPAALPGAADAGAGMACVYIAVEVLGGQRLDRYGQRLTSCLNERDTPLLAGRWAECERRPCSLLHQSSARFASSGARFGLAAGGRRVRCRLRPRLSAFVAPQVLLRCEMSRACHIAMMMPMMSLLSSWRAEVHTHLLTYMLMTTSCWSRHNAINRS